MRSWNWDPAVRKTIYPFCSQFTNEELKLFSFLFVLPLDFCSQFTNEELKPGSGSFFTETEPCSQFTNEELKLIFNLSLNKIAILFAIYQWGVETNFSTQLNNLLLWCSQFTNEELKPRYICMNSCSKRNVRNLPMRSWNFLRSLKCCYCLQFAIYQWGVET